jgi:hypothetical protein
VEAIAYEDDVAQQDKPFADAARQLFMELSGKLADIGLLPDPSFVAALPPRRRSHSEK